jgi:hypothetical protein
MAPPLISVRHPRPHDIVDDPVEVDPDVIVPGQDPRIPQ